jgi:ABC-type nitrate/sulfonate/bicarbonate transport system ATPase subunit
VASTASPLLHAEERPGTGSRLVVHGLTKVFTGGRTGTVVAFEDVSFSVADREFVSILGPSGCGKTTLLHVTAGLDVEDSGSVAIDGAPVPPRQRAKRFGYMFQKDLLMPWSRVIDNVAMGIELQGVSAAESRERAGELMDKYGLGVFKRAYPAQLSGGMRQRAALIRTLLVDRPMMLLDEPFGALDALTRSIMQEWLLRVWEQSGKTILFVTHDVEEAVFLSDRVLVMSRRPGRIKLDVRISLPRPRTRDVLRLPEFADRKNQLLDAIYEEGVQAIEEGN